MFASDDCFTDKNITQFLYHFTFHSDNGPSFESSTSQFVHIVFCNGASSLTCSHFRATALLYRHVGVHRLLNLHQEASSPKSVG